MYEHKFNARKRFKLPYTHNIQVLLKEYGFQNIKVQGPIYEINRNFASSIDLNLTNKMNKNDKTQAKLVSAYLHLIRWYQKHLQTYGSKNPEQEVAGSGIVILNDKGQNIHKEELGLPTPGLNLYGRTYGNKKIAEELLTQKNNAGRHYHREPELTSYNPS